MYVYDDQYHDIVEQMCSSFDFNTFRDLDRRYAEQMAMKIARFSQIFDLRGGTSTIPNWRLKQFLLTAGVGAFMPYTDGKLYFMMGNLGGIQNQYYMPTEFVFANPHMPDGRSWSGNFKIGEQCVLAKNDSTMTGIIPILKKHTVAQVQCDLSFYLALISSRMTNAAVAGRDGEASAVKLMFDDIERGTLSSITDRNVLQQLKALPFGGDAAVIKEYIEFIQYDKAAEANELGLMANWNAKRESIAQAETLLNDDVTHPFVDDMMQTWQGWIDEVNEKYGDLLDNGLYSIDWGSSWKTNEEEKAVLTNDTIEQAYGVSGNNEYQKGDGNNDAAN